MLILSFMAFQKWELWKIQLLRKLSNHFVFRLTQATKVYALCKSKMKILNMWHYRMDVSTDHHNHDPAENYDDDPDQ